MNWNMTMWVTAVEMLGPRLAMESIDVDAKPMGSKNKKMVSRPTATMAILGRAVRVNEVPMTVAGPLPCVSSN